jgi:hypothetical protein
MRVNGARVYHENSGVYLGGYFTDVARKLLL